MVAGMLVGCSRNIGTSDGVKEEGSRTAYGSQIFCRLGQGL